MTEYTGDLRAAVFDHADLTGARLRKTDLTGAWLQMVDLSGATLRDVSLAGADVDGEIDGLRINGIEVAPLVDAELRRRYPERALTASDDPDDLRAAWELLQQAWAATCARVAAMPPGTDQVSVHDEWSFRQTLRHLVLATDAWLGGTRGEDRSFHPWGLGFTDMDEYVPGGGASLGLDPTADPGYEQVLEVRADRVDRVRTFLASATADSLAQPVRGPVWAGDEPISALRCVRVILNEEFWHHRFAVRDLDVIAAGGAGG